MLTGRDNKWIQPPLLSFIFHFESSLTKLIILSFSNFFLANLCAKLTVSSQATPLEIFFCAQVSVVYFWLAKSQLDPLFCFCQQIVLQIHYFLFVYQYVSYPWEWKLKQPSKRDTFDTIFCILLPLLFMSRDNILWLVLIRTRIQTFLEFYLSTLRMIS